PHHYVLLSFPTRRSSDLVTRTPAAWLFALPFPRTCGARGRTPGRRRRRIPSHAPGHARVRFGYGSGGRRSHGRTVTPPGTGVLRSEEHTSELQSRENLVC